MKKIALVIPYVGNLRNDFPFWMKSIEYNPSIDFLMFTDCDIIGCPRNLHIYKMDFGLLQNMFQNSFDFQICLKRPYKFCDFRPAYGEIFAEYLKEYDFWGYRDLDLVFGNIRSFITDELLGKYDHIFGRGHFSLFKNTPKINAIYHLVQEPNYKQVFTFSEGCAFDEYYGISRYWDLYLHDSFFQDKMYDDIDCYKYSFDPQLNREVDLECKNFIYSFNNGRLFRICDKKGELCKIETMYVHFQKRNMKINTMVADQFMIVPNAFLPFLKLNDVDSLKKYTHHTIFYNHYYKLQWNRIKNKFRKYVTRDYSKEYGKPKLPNSIHYYKK